MADNTTLNTGSGGDVIATDDIGGVKHQRVKIQHGADGSATDVSTASPLPVGDAGGSLTVDVGTALPSGTNNIGDVDVLSVVPGTGATNLGKAEDDAHGSGDVGVMALAVRRDSASAGGADGDYVALSTDSTGALRVTSSGGGSGTSAADDTAFIPGSTGVTPAGGFYLAARDQVNDGDTGALAMTELRALYTTIETPDGDSAMDETNNSVRVSIVAGSGSGGTSMTDDAAFTVGTSGVTPAAGIYRTSRDLVDDGDAGALAMTQRRGLLVTLENSSGTELGTAGAPVITRIVDGDGDSCMDNANDALRAIVVDAPPIVLAAGASEIGSVRITDGTDTAAISSAGDLAVTAVVRDGTGDSCMDDTNNALRVNVVAGGSGASMTDDAAFTPGSTSFTPMGGTYRTSRDVLDDNDGGAVALTERRAQLVTLESSAGTAVPTGGGVEAAALRVTIASDSTGLVSVDDGGGSLTVDFSGQSVAVTQVTPGTGATDLGKAEDAAHSSGDTGVMMLAVRRDSPASGAGADGDYATLNVDSAGALRVTGGGGGTEYVEDIAAPTDPTGATVMTRRADSLSGSTVSDANDWQTLQSNARGALWVAWEGGTNGPGNRIVDDAGDSCMDGANDALRVAIVSGGGSGGTAMTDDAAFTPGSTQVTPVAGTYRTTRDTLNDNDAGAVAITERRAVYTSPESPAGDSLVDDTLDALKTVDAYVGTEDSAAPGTPSGTPLVFRRKDSLSPIGDDGDWISPNVTDNGEIYVKHADSVNVTGTLAVSAVLSSVDTELPTAAALSDGFANPTTPVVGAALMGFNGSDWDRLTSENVSGAMSLSVVPTRGFPERTATGTLTAAAQSVSDSVSGRAGCGIEVTGTWVATLQFEGRIEGTAWFALPVFPLSGAPVTSTTANGVWFTRIAGLTQVRVRCSAYTSGTANVQITQSTSGDIPAQMANGMVAEDAAHASGDLGTVALAVRRDTAAAGSGTDGDYSTLNVNSSGRLYTSTTIDAALPAGTNNIGDVDVLTLPGVAGTAAHDAAVSGNPLLNGYEARTSDGTAVGNGDAVRGAADTLGKQVVLIGSVQERVTRGLTNYTNNSAADVIAAAGAGVRIIVMGILVVNAHATVSTKVTIRDGTNSRVTGYAAAAGGGFSIASSTPIFVGTANTAVTAICGTTGADVDVTVWGYLAAN